LLADEEDFSIKVLSNLDQYVREAQVARWDFDVVPRRSGDRVLRILVTMRLQVEGKDEVVDIESYERQVVVQVAPIRATANFLGHNWQWIAGTIVVPMFVWSLAHTEFGINVVKRLGLISEPPLVLDWSKKFFKPTSEGTYFVVSNDTYNNASIDQEIVKLGKTAIEASKCFSNLNNGWRLLFGTGLDRDAANDVVRTLSSRGIHSDLRFVNAPPFQNGSTYFMCW
jgi:hypothetical protein